MGAFGRNSLVVALHTDLYVRIELEVRTAIIILIVVILAVSTGSAVATQLVGTDEPLEHESDFVTLEDGTVLWPYTSQSPSFADRTLSLNFVIYGDAGFTRWVLRDDPFRAWEEVDEDREDIAPAEHLGDDFNRTPIGFTGAAGSDRWIWVDPPDGDPLWLPESYQLEDGDYLGHRHHLRAYEDPSAGSWTVFQAHAEHWDWFHLRHTVHSIERSQLALEEHLLDSWFVADLHRERFGNVGSADADGWVTIVELQSELLISTVGILAILLLGARTVTDRRRVEVHIRDNPELAVALRAVFVILAIVIAYHAIRFGAIAAERWFTDLSPKSIIAVGYPLLIIGMPIVGYLTSRRLDATMAFAAASLGFVIATFIDYSYLGVLRIPLETFVHRGTLAIAIGLIAAGASETARDPHTRREFVRTGVLLWIVAIAIPLFQFI